MKIDPRYLEDGWRYVHGHYSKNRGGAMCHNGRLYNDGYMTTVDCSIKGDYADCATCEYNDDYDIFVDKDEYLYKK